MPDTTALRVGREVAGAMLLHTASEFASYTASRVIAKQTEEDEKRHQFVEPKTFCKAFDHPDPMQHAKWHAAIHNEFSQHDKSQHLA